MPDSTPVNRRSTAAFDKAVAKAEQQAAGSGQTAAEQSSMVSRTELASLASKIELSSLVREIKEPAIVDLSDKNLEKFIQPELIERKPGDDDGDGPSYSEALLYTKELMKNYNTVAQSVTSVMGLLRDEQSNIAMLLALPKRVYGYFTYGPNADDDKPLKNAKVAISGFYTLASPSNPSIVQVECTTDDNGYFEVQMPAGYKLSAGSLDFLVTRGKVGDEISVSRVDLTVGQGNIGSHRLKKEFVQSEGILERLDDIIYHIKDVLEDLDDAEEETLGQPKVVLGEEGTEFSLTWAGSAISKYTYKLLHRLVEPELTVLNMNQNIRPVAGNDLRAAFSRLAISGPIDVESAKSQLLWYPDTVPIMSSLGMGYILSLRQEWTPTNFSLGNLLYSLALAPGEEQKLIVTERADAYTVNDAETLSDQASETYQSSQADDTSAIYNSAMREQIHASSEYYAKEKGGGSGLITGLLLGSSSSTTLSGWSTSNQNYAKDFSSNFAETFNQQIQRSASNMRNASRTGIRMATSEESHSVTSKIIANNNHSHALTMQYWEVLRNYSINTKVDDVQLACYIPLKPVRFLPAGARQVIQSKDLAALVSGGTTGDDKSGFYTRYDTLLRHYDAILPYVPLQHRKGLTTLKTFATHPAWKFQKNYLDTTFEVTLTVDGSFLPYDDMQAYIVLKDGRRIRGQGIMTAYDLDNPSLVPKDRDEVIQLLKILRNNPYSGSYTATFMVPTAAREEFSHLEFGPAAAGAFASLVSASQGFFSTGSSATSSASAYTFISHYMPSYLAGYAANPSSIPDFPGFASLFTGLINEQYKQNRYRLNQSELSRIGPPRLGKVLVERVDSDPEILIQREGNIPPAKTTLRFGFDSVIPMMTMTQLQSIEATFQHVVENTIAYSQAVWLSLTADERAMLLELFSIGVPAAGGTDLGAQ
ncbi:MAG: hypothetical protein FWH28_07705, partial [Clostridiales bacterium]|nr:hypothetical protein [Clostridiales bacterium]